MTEATETTTAATVIPPPISVNEPQITVENKPEQISSSSSSSAPNDSSVLVGEGEEKAAAEVTATEPVMSKRQKNRLLREQHRKEAWKAKRKQERERKKQKRAAAAALAKESNAPDSWVARKRKKTMWKEIDELGIKPSATVVIDLFFSDKMTPKESKSLINQICYSYSYNGRSKVVEDDVNGEKPPEPKVVKKEEEEKELESEKVNTDDDVTSKKKSDAEIPKFFDLVMSSFKGPIVEYADRLGGKEFWKFTSWDPRHLTEIYPKEKIVYLTSESDNVLDDVVDDKVYVIGGIVDHNRLKGITHEDATKRGLYTARLPLDEYVDMQSRKVLTVNHVFMILLGVLNTHDWAKTLSAVLPKRKDPHFKSNDDNNEDGEEDDDENENNEEENDKDDDDKIEIEKEKEI